MDVSQAFVTLAISAGLGLLVGLQRERVDAPLAGIRTFALITLLGTLCAMVSFAAGPWAVGAGLVGVTLVVVSGNVMAFRNGRQDSGITTEIAILVMYGVGALLVFGDRALAVVLGAAVAVLLHAKPVMHGFVKRLGETDMRVIMQFVLISLVILPVLPDATYGPFRVLNPREIWWMVVLVVGINLAGYVALKYYGDRAGIVLAGLIGGVVSSTATTVSYARHTTGRRGRDAAAALVIVLATSVVYGRVLFEIAAVAPSRWVAIAPPVMVMLLAAVGAALWIWWRTRQGELAAPSKQNPTELKPALIFGLLYAVVLVGVAAAREFFGDRGVYVAAAISGLTDMDAITLSTSRLAARDALPAGVAGRAIVIAAMSNLAFKLGIVAMLGGVDLARRVGLGFAAQFGAGLAILLLWTN